jgi:hypothetical protein
MKTTYRSLAFWLTLFGALSSGCSSSKPTFLDKQASESKSAIRADSVGPAVVPANDAALETNVVIESKAVNGHSTTSTNPNKTVSPLRHLRAPRLTNIELPAFKGAHAIWGATGRDSKGQIYFGAAAYGVDDPSAHLFRLTPSTGIVADLGGVNSTLDELGVRRQEPYPETQMKIHSKLHVAGDGKLYFSSQDEHDEAGDGSRNALFGGRLLALDTKTEKWSSILRTPEGLIAIACHQRYVFALGYFGHVIYQFDTQTGNTRSVKVGTVGGHVSRNLFTDSREHVYAIRLENTDETEGPGVTVVGNSPVKSSLVELNAELQEVKSWPLDDYLPTLDVNSHGLTAYCHVGSDKIVFLTHSGALWQIKIGEPEKAAELTRLGWFHPGGSRYAASLFCPAGKRYVCGFSQSSNGEYEWVLFDIDNKESTILPISLSGQELLQQPGLLLYGCDTLDNEGCGYVVGWKRVKHGYGPHVLRLEWR